MIFGHEPERLSAAMRSSRAFFNISARKLPGHVTANGLVELVEDRPGREQHHGFHIPGAEELTLDHA
jgi:hypothetical protein